MYRVDTTHDADGGGCGTGQTAVVLHDGRAFDHGFQPVAGKHGKQRETWVFPEKTALNPAWILTLSLLGNKGNSINPLSGLGAF